jgi:exopolysaccharide biosynthesis polyprenyl glycosylphosphotransferase
MGALTPHDTALGAEDLMEAVGARTLEVVAHRHASASPRRRGWLVRRLLLAADIVGLVAAFVLAPVAVAGRLPELVDWVALVGLLPVWVLLAKVYGLYDRDEERAAHSTVDDVVGVFHLVTVGAWVLLVLGIATSVARPDLGKLALFWVLAIVLLTLLRGAARAAARRSLLYVQNLVIIGAGHVGQLVARKVLQHPEYGINLVGFVDDHPRERRADVSVVPVLGRTARLPEIVAKFDVDRVVIAFMRQPEPAAVDLVRSLRDLDVQVDVVPRLFDLIGPRVANHSIEALPLVGLAAARPSRSWMFVKRLIDVAGAAIALVLTAPVFAAVAIAIRHDSPGPALFRQTRLGLGMRRFTALKFRTMRVDTDDALHRRYIADTMSARATVGESGMYKLEREDAVTRVGSFLRRTSLDELPQLLNVLRGDMSLVGPRPCIPYETEQFAPHHFERFRVPAGITGYWQVWARARSTFGEALDMDVAYARSWSLGLDLRLLCRTPFEVLRRKGTA